ncbi:BTAD domain-containing putative transcriptional regulator [Microtetraspora malaysiensis]|uniref:BTAD domain-containing putative transcriptional regulator n=1 Tax=Microtetraspora malaysiensis TaxID=161358 RepID=UPI000AC8759F|nr:BTAD domain-containing putative transcriptional regulator [Microtetraspora malaysiensis]
MRAGVDDADAPGRRTGGASSQPGNRLDFHVLGTLEVVDGAGARLDIGSRKQRALLALLLLNAPHVVPLDQLIDRLWADEPPSSATGTLQAYISHLRRTLEPRRSPRSPARVLRTREPGYLLDITPSQLDAERFARAADAAHAALADGKPEDVERILRPALVEWRGDPLADFADEAFAQSTIARLVAVRLSALTVRAEAWLALGRPAAAAVEVERLLEREPYREGLWALLIRALYQDRRQAEALAAYQRCRALLGDELGIDPSPELRGLEQAVLNQDELLVRSWSPAAPPVAELRRPPGPILPRLVGREPHLRRIGERLDDLRQTAGGVLLVTGESGIGKTRLAEAAAEMAAERGVTVAWSRCVEGSGAPAFWPWIQALQALPGDLPRQRGTERMGVAPLTSEQIVDYLAEAGGPATEPELARALHDRTGGNPFFLGEMLRLLSSVRTKDRVDASDVLALAVPDGVRDVINQRVSRLPEDCQTLLRTAAVIGRDVDADVLETATGIGGARLMTLLEPAVATGLLVEVDGGWDYRFSHALVQEALYSGLSRRQRAQLHGRVGEAVESLSHGDAASRLSALARHFGLAARVGYTDKAIAYAAEAARRAAATLAYDEAVMHWERALEAATGEPALRRCRLLIELGRARRATGDVEGARATLDEAVTLGTQIGDDEAVIEAAAVFGGVTLWNWRHYGMVDQGMVRVLEDQLHRLDPRAAATRAELLGTLGVELYYGDRREEGRRHALEAVELARELGDTGLLARTLNNFVIAAWRPEHEEERCRAAEEILTLPALPRATEIIARLHRMPTLLRAGRLAEYDAELARCLRMIDEVRMPEIETQVTFAATGRAILGGDWTQSTRLVGLATGAFRRTSLWGPDPLKLIGTFFCEWGQGRGPALLPALVEGGANESNLLVRPTAVLAAVESGDEGLAHRLMDRWGTAVQRDWTWQFVMWQWGLVAARLGRPDPGDLLDELRPIAAELVTLGTGCVSWGALHDVVAMLLHRTGDVAGALAHAEAGRETHRRLGLRHLEERSLALFRRLSPG